MARPKKNDAARVEPVVEQVDVPEPEMISVDLKEFVKVRDSVSFLFFTITSSPWNYPALRARLDLLYRNITTVRRRTNKIVSNSESTI